MSGSGIGRWRLRVLTVALVLGAVACGGSHTAKLTWSRTLRNSDGSPLTDLAGYEIHYGSAPNALNEVIVLKDPSQTSYEFTNLKAGTWYFTVNAYTRRGVLGSASKAVTKTIR